MTDDLIAFLNARLDEDEYADWHVYDCAGRDSGCCAVPARTLREVAAKRAIITRYAAVLQSFNDRGNGLWPDVSRREKSHAYATLCDLAAIWSDHPDYQDGWVS